MPSMWATSTETRGLMHNIGVNLTVRPVTRLAGLLPIRDSHGRAQGARPSRTAGYAGR
jgi:hypothetical protein